MGDDDEDSLERLHGVGLGGLAVHAAGELEAEGLFHEVRWYDAQGPTGERIARLDGFPRRSAMPILRVIGCGMFHEGLAQYVLSENSLIPP